MRKASPSRVLPRAKWRVGFRVIRNDSKELGTVVEIDKANQTVKVKWGGGATSYYHHGKRANVRLIDRLP